MYASSIVACMLYYVYYFMILILSGDGDASTDLVVEYLAYSGQNFLRLNAYDLLNEDLFISSVKGKTTMDIAGQEVNIEEIGAVWYRKFGFFYKSPQYGKIKSSYDIDIANNISKEFTSLLETIVCLFYEKNWLTHPTTIGINKFNVLRQAQKLGLKTPNSYIVNRKKKLLSILKDEECISKSLRDPWIIRSGVKAIDKSYSMFTSIIEEEDIKSITNKFFPSLVQDKIDKDIEIRTFFLGGEFYSMCIFSQLDNQTSVDFRRYNWKNPNRTVPYQLPDDVQKKLINLLDYFKFNCCSLDLIKGKDGEYYLLEINPTGQFGMVSEPCNYGLHEKVGNYLIELNKLYHEKTR